MGTPKKTAKADATVPKTRKAAPAAAPAASSSEPPAPGDTTTQAASVQTDTAGSAAAEKPFVDTAPPAPVIADTATAVHRLARAQALTELEKSKDDRVNGTLAQEGIQSFKDVDGRTMNVVVAGGALYKQEV